MLWTTSNATWTYEWNTEPYLGLKSDSSIFIIDSLPEYVVVTVEVSNSSGCVAQAQIAIQAIDCKWTIYFPNALVPSGANSTWFPKFTNVVIRELTIWDRYGHLQWTYVNNEFDGVNNKGSEMIGGVYTYLAVYSPQGKKVEYRKIGKVVIIK